MNLTRRVFNNNCMISYSNYRNIFPLWALGEYTRAVHGGGGPTPKLGGGGGGGGGGTVKPVV